MEAEYSRIRKRASADPGTAGDEGEENWAELLRDWLPPSYRVITKGRLLDEAGRESPQVDVLVLKPIYPAALHHKKKYLLSGVAAVFECKLTLERKHVYRAVETAAAIKGMTQKGEGTPYKELMTSPLFGLLSHAHSWAAKSAVDTIDKHLSDADDRFVTHPREMLDLVCVSNLATWSTSKSPLADPALEVDPDHRLSRDPKGTPTASYMCYSGQSGFASGLSQNFSPLGVFLSELLVKLAWDDEPLRDLASYFLGVDFASTSVGQVRYWNRGIYSPALRRKLTLKTLRSVLSWDEWATSIE